MRIASICTLGACALALVACGASEKKEAGAAPPTAAKPAPPPGPAPKPKPAPEPAAQPATAPAFACLGGDVARGKALYAQYCATCHGIAGDGEGPAAAGLNPKPAKHSNGGYMNALGNDHLYKVIAQGGGAVGKSPLMTPWGGVLSKAQIDDVVAFVRSVAKPPYECP